jgi:uncharacterized repeat protein (TIGR01451 family)
VGLVAGSAALLVAGVVPLAYVAYGSLSTAPSPGALDLTREIEPSPAPPGRPVDVTLTVRNVSDRPLADVRVVDAVPADLAVLAGTPRAGGSLDAGEAFTIQYRLAARRGTYDFEPPRVRVRSLGAGSRETRAVAPAGDDALVCRLDADAPPIEDQGSRLAGQLTTDRPGSGLEFHSTREYHPEDPADRIDWRHYAKRGNLTTINYRKRRAATVVVVVDARPSARVVAGPGRPTAVELGAYAATQAVTELVAVGHDVAVAVLGADGPDADSLHWIAPGNGRHHRARALDVLRAATETEADAEESDAQAQIDRVAQLAPPRAQLVFVSPMLDDEAVAAVERWGAHEFARSVLSPDVLTHSTLTGQFEQIRRGTRLARCQATDARTIDWRRGTPLPIVLEYAIAARTTGGTR